MKKKMFSLRLHRTKPEGRSLRGVALILALNMCLIFTACGMSGERETSGYNTPSSQEVISGANSSVESSAESSDVTNVKPNGESWSVYWYLCGSDLESNNGFATDDLQEMLEITLPENVNVVIQTGGAAVWHNEFMDSSKIQRWLYNSEGFQLLDERPSANMGDAQTLQDFLSFAYTNYPADKIAVTFWNHGGGSVSGAAFDELYDSDSLDLAEMYSAFNAVWPANTQSPALELVGFDTCLMATIDVAAVFQNFSKYLVASEEEEPGNGWLYSGWLGELAENPAMKGIDLAISICNTYYDGCEEVGTQDSTTLSVTDLTKLDALLEAYENFGQEALALAAEDPGFFADFGRAANQSENYGGNTKEQGYTNMVDLGHLARQTAWMLPSAQSVSDALAKCVVYKVGGIYRAEATGLSCYYSYDGNVDDLNGYIDMGTGSAFKYLYSYGVTGRLAPGGDEYLESLDIAELQKPDTLLDTNWDDSPLTLNEEGASTLTLGPQAADILSGIAFSLYYINEETDTMMLLGTDNDIVCDWDNGVFSDNFRGVWGAIDGYIVYMEISFEGDDYNLYSVPVLLNGEMYYLQVVYDFTTETWDILGANRGVDDSGMASKEMRLLQVGDEIETIWQIASYSGDDDFEMYVADKFTVTANTSFDEAPLDDGEYMLIFEMCDYAGNYAYSDAALLECDNGEIFTLVG